MSVHPPTGGRQSGAVFHVGDRVIPLGQALRPNAIARECADSIRLAGHAVDRGPDAVRCFVSADAWEHGRGRGGCWPEMVLLEVVFERVRARVEPRLPSRLDAVFAWPSLGLARRFRDEYRSGGVIHRCVFVAGTAIERDGALVVDAYETADLRSPSREDLQRVAELATRYWRAHAPMALPEVLVQGTVVVASIVDHGNHDRSG